MVAEIFKILAAINETEGVSILIVEQNASLALDLADHVVLIETGRVALQGPSVALRADDAVRRSYLDPGTEVSAGELPYRAGTSLLPAYSVTSNIDVTSPAGSFRRQPLSDPWDLPGFPKW